MVSPSFAFPGRNLLFLFILSIMTVPFQILVIPMFVLVRQLGWHNTYEGIIMPGLISAFGVFMMRQFAYSIPDELLDAARIDGASEFSIFRRIALPMLKPAAASLAIITFLFSWNNFLWPLGDRAESGPGHLACRSHLLLPVARPGAAVGGGHGRFYHGHHPRHPALRLLPTLLHRRHDGLGH